MQNFTIAQVLLIYSRLKKVEFDYLELQARLVWAVGNGWSKPKSLDASSKDLKRMGILEDR